MRQYRILELKKGDSVVFRGTAREIAFKLGLPEVENVYSVVQKGTYCKGYKIEKTLEYTLTEDKEAHDKYIAITRELQRKCVPHTPKRTRADNLNYLKRHLLEYGYKNCYTKFDPFPYLPDLLDMGLDCTAREWVSLPERYNLTKQHRSRKPKHEGYIVEVKKWTTEH